MGINQISIDKINKENVGQDIKLTGKVTRVSEADKVYFIELSQPSTISVIVFKGDSNLSIIDGNNVEIIGEIDEYNGNLEIIGNRIRVIG